MRKELAWTVILAVAIPCSVMAQVSEPEVRKLLKAGVSETVILNFIQMKGAPPSLSADDIVDLKQAGATDQIIAAMMQPGPQAPQAPEPGAGTPSVPAALPNPPAVPPDPPPSAGIAPPPPSDPLVPSVPSPSFALPPPSGPVPPYYGDDPTLYPPAGPYSPDPYASTAPYAPIVVYPYPVVIYGGPIPKAAPARPTVRSNRPSGGVRAAQATGGHSR